ncbi:fibronectin type III domain-containing protein [Bdellovibrio sp. 22V]|uniref:fibronectin type III domain-containing protein n=1 Tax=Bdellovibrio TaxID=958 RepID=UPI0025428DAC|nr:fibronectin type III domain-containing protein [Bdellovibrio sp. 22V]WII72568.1 fibronectin type III domain-containing protein [Bdellovibrio sp. 22V]
MKILVSLFAFALTLALTSPSLADQAHEQQGKGHGGGHGNLAEKMNALFPEKQPHAEKRQVPSAPELVSPEFYSTVKSDKVTLQWKAVNGADEYHVEVATDPNFKWIVAQDYHHKGTSFEATGLEAGKHYFWRVAAVGSQNWSTFRKSFFAKSMFETPAAAAK